jgi:D-lactate dehydrogenase
VCESDDVEVVEPDRKEATLEIQRIEQFIHPSRVLTSYLHHIAYANDASYFRLVPQVVVQPNSLSEIQSLFILMTFRAAGTSCNDQTCVH